MEKKTVNVYQFKELAKEIQDKLIEKEKETQQELYCEFFLQDEMKEKAAELLEEYFGKNAKLDEVYYSLSCCQGDGAMIVFKINLEDINKKYKKLTKRELEKIEAVGYSDIEVKHAGHYYHERCFDVDYHDYTYYIDNFEKQQAKLDEMMEAFKNDIINMNSNLAKYGYEATDGDNWTDEAAIERLEEDKYFTDGSIFCYE